MTTLSARYLTRLSHLGSRLFARRESRLLVASALIALTAGAEEAPEKSLAEGSVKTWEVGLGLGALVGPDYRGSDEYRTYASPIPYFIYRGKVIQSDRDGVRGRFLQTPRYELSLSASAAITPDADNNKRREGMPELGSTLEIGPSFNLFLSGDSGRRGWQLQLPWREVFAMGGDDAGHVGALFQPQLVYTTQLADWRVTYRAGVSFANRDYHAYYYRVAPEYARPDRPAAEVSGGYSGWHNGLALSRRFDWQGADLRLALFVRYDNIDHTPMDDSPLVMTHSSGRGGLALIWVIK